MEIEEDCYLSSPCQHYVTIDSDRKMMDGFEIALLINETHPMYNHFKKYLKLSATNILIKIFHPYTKYMVYDIKKMSEKLDSLSAKELKEIINEELAHPCICNKNVCKFK